MDILIKNGIVYTNGQFAVQDILIENGFIKHVGALQNFEFNGKIIDATAQIILPGLIDFHVHLDDQIGEFYLADSYYSGSNIAIENGITTLCSFITQNKNSTLKQAIKKASIKAEKTFCDLTWHLTPTTFSQNDWTDIFEAHEKGFKTIKLYTTYKSAGIYSSYSDIEKILKKVARLNMRVLIHCEDDETIENCQSNFDAQNAFNITKIRPKIAEIEAIKKLIDIAKKTCASIHIVHVSTIEGLELIEQARAECDISCETCPQYLFFNDNILYEQDGYKYLCTPPLRDEINRKLLFEAAQNGKFDILATDHCPFLKTDKAKYKNNFNLVPKGMPGIGALPHIALKLFNFCENKTTQNMAAFKKLAYHLCEKPAKLCGLFPQKGAIQAGSDADLVIINQDQTEHKIKSTYSDSYDLYNTFTSLLNIKYVLLKGKIVVENNCAISQSTTGIKLCKT